MQLTTSDYDALERCYIPRALADAAGLYRVPSIEGRDLIGRKGGGNFGGIVYPVIDSFTKQVVANFLRLDHPPVDSSTGKVGQKYLCAPGQRNKILWSLEDPAHLADSSIPVAIVEGPKKYYAMHRAAWETAHLRNGSSGKPAWVTIAFSGVWNWRGTIGTTTDAQGNRIPVKGPIPDLDKLPWSGRPAVICYDSNAAFQDQVRQARRALARHLTGDRGAQVSMINLPVMPGVNGPDDFLAIAGLDAFLDLWDNATAWDWHSELVRSDKGKIQPLLGNALTALRLAPEWSNALAFNELKLEIEIARPTPWNSPLGAWRNHDDTLLAEWLEHQGICVSTSRAAEAAVAIAREHKFHPVRQYLESLTWDGTGRIDDWLTLYLRVKESDYARAIGPRWLISAIARIYQPGCQADHTLILEGPQGVGKSTVFRILGGEFYSDDIPELGTKDAQLWVSSVWIAELAELDAMGKAEVSRIKKFLGETHDRFRPPYERHMLMLPRGCVFGGSINSNRYFKDETGNRRFWPAEVGQVLRLDDLARDRDQLWAEALARYRKGEHWWLEAPDLIEAATAEQEERLQDDPWEPLIETWLITQVEVTTAEVLAGAIQKVPGQWTRADETRVGTTLHRLNWKPFKRPAGNQRRLYRYQP